MAQYGFGLGVLSFTDTRDAAASRYTPIVCGVLQDVSLEIAMQNKELRGNMQFPVDVARGAGSVQGKARFANLSIGTVSAILNADVNSALSVKQSVNEATAITTHAGTITPPGGGSFYELQMLVRANDGKVLTRVADAGTPTADQFTLTTSGTPTIATIGLYASDSTTTSVLATYTYTDTDIGSKVTLSNQLMGAGLTFTLNLHNNFRSKHFGWRLPAVTIPKFGFAPKVDDYTTMDVDFQAFADSTGKVLEYFGVE